VVVDAAAGIVVVGRGPAARGVFRAIVIDLAARCADAVVGAAAAADADVRRRDGVELRCVGDRRIATLDRATPPPTGIGGAIADEAVAVFLGRHHPRPPDPVAIVLLLAGDDPDTRGSSATSAGEPRSSPSTARTRIVVTDASCTVESCTVETDTVGFDRAGPSSRGSATAVSRVLLPRFPERP
jgi:hypothetical protein